MKDKKAMIPISAVQPKNTQLKTVAITIMKGVPIKISTYIIISASRCPSLDRRL